MSVLNHAAINTVARMDAEYPPDPRGTTLRRPGRRLTQRRRNPEEVFDFSESQISPIYLSVLYNTFLRKKVHSWHRRGPWHEMYGSGQRYNLWIRKRRRKPSREETKGSDSNGASRSGLFSDVDCSPRGYRVGNWTVHQVHYESRNTGPRQGSLKRRSVPAPENRRFFPTLIREDKHEEEWLLRRTLKRKVEILQDAQRKYYQDKLDKEYEETVESIKRMRLVIVQIDDTIKTLKRLAIENESVNTAHSTVMARKSGV